jgi:hypothetical protein
MYLHALESLRGVEECAAILYYLKGHQIATTLRDSWGVSPPSALLDFASGFGRSTRFLVRETPAERIWVSEIQPGAVEFQQKVFGVQALPSAGDPDGFRAPRRFPLIVASSFFSHVPPPGFPDWLRSLLNHLEPAGTLLFSVHGQSLAPAGSDWSEGIVFLPESESRALSPEDYGTTYVTEDYVRRAVRNASGGRADLAYIPFGFCGVQDLCLVSERKTRDEPAIGLFPRGDLTSLSSDAGALRLQGWVSAGEASPDTLAVNLYVGSELRDSVTPSAGATDEARPLWILQTDMDFISPDEVVAVTAVGPGGRENILAMGTLRSAGLV